MNDTADVGKAIREHLYAEGRVPNGGMVVEVDYIAVALVRVLHDDGSHEVYYNDIVSTRIEPHEQVGAADWMRARARQRMGY
jgi:hypothetical protein